METWFVILVSFCCCVLIRAILSLYSSNTNTNTNKNNDIKNKSIKIPPGPLHIPIITTIAWLRKISELEQILRGLHAKYGPIITIRIVSRPSIFIRDRTLAHHALIQNGSLFSDRPKPLPTRKFLSSNQHNISSASYGPTWRVLRRNLISEMLHHSRIKSFSSIRKWVLETLLTLLKSDSESNDSILVMDHFQYAMFCLLVFMCFGERVDDEKVKDIERVQRKLLLSINRFNILNFWPKLTAILFRERWEELLRLRKEQEDVLVPLIRARKQAKEGRVSNDSNTVVSYVDTLLDLKLPEEKRKLNEGEIVSLCSEFLNAGTDTTSTALQWIMANLVKYPHVQQKLVEEIREVVGDREVKEVKEEDLEKMGYLKAVILEGLRRHPPGHFVLPHAVTEDVVLNGYLVPKNGTVNFMVAEMGWDPEVWEDPMEFKPERFLNQNKAEVEAFDITGSKEIKMMPFGAGRRICPAYNLAMIHLEYFVANLVLSFDWKVSEGGHVDFTEKQEFTTVMKNPLQVHISPRI
ncbi:cytochrome P450 89A2-like [Gastrolobium bilobum]|uniref:cytochrome P450 89A2-like n=1 Tax=Gastrolobium bilobum TaxID=150636 RepID=UPI002AAF5466|nr:cytochrome P450 89A2-like [Gastrolobium bilobum]